MSDDPVKSARGRPRTLKRAALLDDAMTLYWEEGPEAVSLNAVCQTARVSKPSVYREFGNEDGLTCAVLEHYASLVLVKMHQILTGEGGFAEKLQAVAHLAAEDALHKRGCLLVKMRAARPQMGERTQDLIDAIEAASLGAFRQVLTEARATGDWASDIPDDLAAKYLQAQFGLALDMRGRGEDAKDILAMALSVFRIEA